MSNENIIWYIYIIETSGNRLYTGITTDIARRFKEHLDGKKSGAKFTRAFKPKKILACWKTPSRSEASKIEAAIKSLSRNEKMDLIENKANLKKLLKEKSIDAKAGIFKKFYDK